jgi:hypothetical protein
MRSNSTWAALLEDLDLLGLAEIRRQNCWTRIQSLQDGETQRRLLLYIALTYAVDRTPRESAEVQMIVTAYLLQATSSGDVVRLLLGRWLTRYWIREAEQRAFLMARPALLRDALRESAGITLADALGILLAAQSATGARVPNDVLQRLAST